jgi:ribose 5-phosphate isomerase B
LVWNDETAVLARQHNDANVISVGGRMHSIDEMAHFVDLFLATPFTGEARHARRIAMLADYEQTGDLPPLPASTEAGARSAEEGRA